MDSTLIDTTWMKVVLGAMVGLLCGCLPAHGESAATSDPFGSGTQCTAYRPPTEPDLMGWDAGSRAKLSRLRSEGVVVVRYEAKGCNVELEVLEGCIAKPKVTYGYKPYAESETKIAKTNRDLFAQLPIGAAALGGRLKDGKVLRTDYMLVGTDALPPDATINESDLKGNDCGRATHVVRAVYLGGFAMIAGASSEVEGGASIFGIGAGASQQSTSEKVAKAGDATACENARNSKKMDDGCSTPLRVALMAVDHKTSAPVAHPTSGSTAITAPIPKSSAEPLFCATNALGSCYTKQQDCVGFHGSCPAASVAWCYKKNPKTAGPINYCFREESQCRSFLGRARTHELPPPPTSDCRRTPAPFEPRSDFDLLLRDSRGLRCNTTQ